MMGSNYWLVHFLWTIPPAILLTLVYWPFFTRQDICKIGIIILIAVLATIPWDSYLIRHSIWSYPPNAVSGPTLFAIPIEEVFFFIIQTYSTSLLYTILSKPLVLPTYLLRLPNDDPQPLLGALAIASAFISGAICLYFKGVGTYLGLILTWASPVVMLQWSVCSHFLLSLPRKVLLYSIVLPSVYLGIVDNWALGRGTWEISDRTKLDYQVFGALEVEEALFFFVTNTMIVFGLVAMDQVIAVSEYYAAKPEATAKPPSLARCLVLSCSDWQQDRDGAFLRTLSEAVDTVSRKSQSMFMGSAMFQGALRIDLIFLYYFCRIMDDLVDESPDHHAARLVVEQCSQLVERQFGFDGLPEDYKAVHPPYQGPRSDTQQDSLKRLKTAVSLLPASKLTIQPLVHLHNGFKTDLRFASEDGGFPIHTEEDLEMYAYNVAASIASMVLGLVFKHYEADSTPLDENSKCSITAGEKMGQALQYVNIARDVERDAAIGRAYFPTTWLEEVGLKPADVIANLEGPRIQQLRYRMLDKADQLYYETVDAIEELPRAAQGPIRTVVESYMMIGKMVRMKKPGTWNASEKLRVPLWRRLWVAWWAMCTR